MKTLMGHLSQFSALSRQGELLCTNGLCYLLEDGVMQSAFEGFLHEVSGFRFGDGMRWYAETFQADGRRPDLEGRAASGKSVVTVEAKLHAEFGESQLTSYADALVKNGCPSLLVVLIPRYRMHEAVEPVVAAGFQGERLFQKTSAAHVGCVIVCWEDVLEKMRVAGPSPREGDLVQLTGLYRSFVGTHLQQFVPRSPTAKSFLDSDFIERVLPLVRAEIGSPHTQSLEGWQRMSQWSDTILRAKLKLWGNKSVSGVINSVRAEAAHIEKGNPKVYSSLPEALREEARRGTGAPLSPTESQGSRAPLPPVQPTPPKQRPRIPAFSETPAFHDFVQAALPVIRREIASVHRENLEGWLLISKWTERVLVEKLKLWRNKSVKGALDSLRAEAGHIQKGNPKVFSSLPEHLRDEARGI